MLQEENDTYMAAKNEFEQIEAMITGEVDELNKVTYGIKIWGNCCQNWFIAKGWTREKIECVHRGVENE